MTNGPIGVGIIGIQPGRSWGAVAHVPALRTLADRFRLVGVANTSPESSRAAAAAIGVTKAFDSAEALIDAPEVEMVAICVKVPHHARLVKAALAAGKHVFCEWPLARTLAEAEELASLPRPAGVVAMAGMQAVTAPTVRYLAQMCAERRFGRIHSSTLVASGMTWGAEIEQRNAYLLDRTNGATMLTIAVGHALSAVQEALGPITRVSAALSTRRDQVRVIETGDILPLRAPDQVMLLGEFASGAPLAMHYRAGLPQGDGLVWEIEGSEASARVTAPSGLIEMTALTLATTEARSGTWTKVVEPVDQPIVDGVRRLYDAAWLKITAERGQVPGFDEALGLHRLIDAIEQAARTGRRVEL